MLVFSHQFILTILSRTLVSWETQKTIQRTNDLKSFLGSLSLVGNVIFIRLISTCTWFCSADLFANYIMKTKISFAQCLSLLGIKFCVGH